MEASGSTRWVHGYFENPINLVLSPPPHFTLSPLLSAPLSLSLSLSPHSHTTSTYRAMKFPRRPNLSLFPGHSEYIRYPRAFLLESLPPPLFTLRSPSKSKPSLYFPPPFSILWPSRLFYRDPLRRLFRGWSVETDCWLYGMENRLIDIRNTASSKDPKSRKRKVSHSNDGPQSIFKLWNHFSLGLWWSSMLQSIDSSGLKRDWMFGESVGCWTIDGRFLIH